MWPRVVTTPRSLRWGLCVVPECTPEDDAHQVYAVDVQHVPGFSPGYCSGSHRRSHNASILTCACTTRSSRTWSREWECSTNHYWEQRLSSDTLFPTCAAVCLYIHSASLRPTMRPCSNGWRCSTGYTLVGEDGCILELMLKTLFTSQSTTVTPSRVKTMGAKTGLLIAYDNDKWITKITTPQYAHIIYWYQWTQSLRVLHFSGSAFIIMNK